MIDHKLSRDDEDKMVSLNARILLGESYTKGLRVCKIVAVA